VTTQAPVWRRLLGSVRVRVTMLAAGVFAVTLVVASVLLLNSLEHRLVGDVRSEAIAELRAQAQIYHQEGFPYSDAVPTASGQFVIRGELASGQPFTAVIPPGVSPGQGSAMSGATVSPDDVFADPGLLLAGGRAADRLTVVSVPIDGAVLATASPLDEVRETLRTTTRLLWWIGPALVALVAGLSWVLASRALRPVRLLTARVSEIESHSLHERVPEPPSSDEIAELARTMNQMLGRLESSNEINRRLVSDASHELRTPVAVMRTELEVARRDPRNDWPATGDVLLGELDRLQGLVDDLLLLARGDERAFARVDVDVAAVIAEVAERRRRVPVEVAGPAGGALVRGDRQALVRAFDHLADNAARSAREHVSIAIEANGFIAVHVDDDGPGIPESDRAMAVQRFVRLDEGRARDVGGAGLGLAVASDVAAAHGGALEIGDSPLGGARVSITLPGTETT
jgi:signal transduction histidine kinase